MTVDWAILRARLYDLQLLSANVQCTWKRFWGGSFHPPRVGSILRCVVVVVVTGVSIVVMFPQVTLGLLQVRKSIVTIEEAAQEARDDV